MIIQKSDLNASIRSIPLPDMMKDRPVSKQGYPVPFFAQMVDGEWDFRVTSGKEWVRCMKEKLCWVCGKRMGGKLSFVAGPMCVVTRTTAEPPCHYSCAVYAALACPFLANPRMRRNEKDLPDGSKNPAGVAILRNPGVTAVLVTRSLRPFDDGHGNALIEMGEPEKVEWYAHRRHATRDEIMGSIDSGLPLLIEQCAMEKTQADRDEALIELNSRVSRVTDRWLPHA